MKQHEKLVCLQRKLREAATVIVGEVDFEGAVQYLDDGADMSAAEAVIRQVRKQSDGI